MFYGCWVGKSLYWVLWQTEEKLKIQFPIWNLRKIKRVYNGFLGVFLPEQPTEWKWLGFLQGEKLTHRSLPLLSESKWANREEIMFRLTSNCLTKILPAQFKMKQKISRDLKTPTSTWWNFPMTVKHYQVQKIPNPGNITWTVWVGSTEADKCSWEQV